MAIKEASLRLQLEDLCIRFDLIASKIITEVPTSDELSDATVADLRQLAGEVKARLGNFAHTYRHGTTTEALLEKALKESMKRCIG